MTSSWQERLLALQSDFDAAFAAPGVATAAAGQLPHLMVMVAKEWFALPAHHVQRLIQGAKVVPLPGAPWYLMGVINLRGELVAVYDTPALYGYPGQVSGVNACLVVTKGLPFDAVFAVNRIGGLIHLDPQDFMPPPAALSRDAHRRIRGTLYHEGRLVIVPDLPYLFEQLDARG